MKNGKTNAFMSQNALLKAFGHKYIRRIPKKSGKGFWYIYAETFKKPFQALAQIFGIKKAAISENYKAQNIERDYGASQTTYAAHVLEYFTNREKWDALFAKEETRKKYRKPQKPKAKAGGARKTGAGKKKGSSGGREKKPTDDAIKVNRSLMYHVWKTYGSGAKSEERSRAMEGNQNAKKDGAEATGGGDGKPKAGGFGGGDDGGKRRGGGSTKGFLFSSLKDNDEKKEELAKEISGTIVAEIEADSVPYKNDGRFDAAAADWIKHHQGVIKTVIGEVEFIPKLGVADMHHGEDVDKYNKLQTLPAVKDVLEKGTYLGYETDFDGKPIDNHYFAGKIKYGGKERIVFCRVRKNAGRGNRFYVHEVFTEEEIKAKPGNSELSALRDKPLYQSILHDIFTATDRIAQKKKQLQQQQEQKKEEDSKRVLGPSPGRLTGSPPGNTLPQSDNAVKKKTQKNAGKRDTAETPDELAQQFGLRGVEISDKVDAKTAQWHVKKCSESFADIADITGIPDKLVSLNGRLSLAIGECDKKGSYAHYSPSQKKININKKDGAGSLAHEWFHAFDNLLADAMGVRTTGAGFFLTKETGLFSRGQREALKAYLNASSDAEREVARKECWGVSYLLSGEDDEHQIKVVAAFEELSKAMTEGDAAQDATINYYLSDGFEAAKKIRAGAGGIGEAIYRAGNFEEAKKAIFERSKSDTERIKWLKLAAAHHLGKTQREGSVKVTMDNQNSAFLMAAKGKDAFYKKNYWSTPIEMAARAFAAYIKDKLAEQGRRNDYLTRDDNDERLYPQGEERKRINAAFDKLFRVIAETNAIRKALDAVAKRKRWLWVDGDGKIWVRKGVLKAWKEAMSE